MIRRNVYVTVGSDEKVKFCESIGATKAINYKTQKWGEVVNRMNKPLLIHWLILLFQNKKINELTDNKGVQLIIDVVGKDYWEQNISSLALDGRMVILAFMSGKSVNQHKKVQSVQWRMFRQNCWSGRPFDHFEKEINSKGIIIKNR